MQKQWHRPDNTLIHSLEMREHSSLHSTNRSCAEQLFLCVSAQVWGLTHLKMSSVAVCISQTTRKDVGHSSVHLPLVSDHRPADVAHSILSVTDCPYGAYDLTVTVV